MWKNVHPVYSTGIRTHNLLITSLLPQPLDQGSRPRVTTLLSILGYAQSERLPNKDLKRLQKFSRWSRD